jgi:hypothetical protein
MKNQQVPKKAQKVKPKKIIEPIVVEMPFTLPAENQYTFRQVVAILKNSNNPKKEYETLLKNHKVKNPYAVEQELNRLGIVI